MKKKMNFTINENVVGEFNKACKQKGINKSALIELMIEKWLIGKEVSK